MADYAVIAEPYRAPAVWWRYFRIRRDLPFDSQRTDFDPQVGIYSQKNRGFAANAVFAYMVPEYRYLQVKHTATVRYTAIYYNGFAYFQLTPTFSRTGQWYLAVSK